MFGCRYCRLQRSLQLAALLLVSVVSSLRLQLNVGSLKRSTAALPTGISPWLNEGSAGDLEITSLRHVTSQESRADMFCKGQVLLRWPKQLLQPLNGCNLQTWVESLLILVKSFSPPQDTVWDDEEWTQPNPKTSPTKTWLWSFKSPNHHGFARFLRRFHTMQGILIESLASGGWRALRHDRKANG